MIHCLLNLIGWMLGYGSCPNCKASWWWKASTRITWWCGNLEARNVSAGVTICKSCYTSPTLLDPRVVAHALDKKGWSWEQIEFACSAVDRHKQGYTPAEF
ncbi:MAG: hypothetical protein AAB389_00905 [Patescibacteria group bacterium]